MAFINERLNKLSQRVFGDGDFSNGFKIKGVFLSMTNARVKRMADFVQAWLLHQRNHNTAFVAIDDGRLHSHYVTDAVADLAAMR